MTDLIEGRLKGWPVSLMVERDYSQCAPYTGSNDEEASDDIMELCHSITDACDGLTPAKALKKAKAMGFVAD